MLKNGKEVSVVLFYQLQDPYSLDLGRFFTGYGIGELTLVKLQPYRQHLVALRKNQKLGMKYFGLFEVIE